MELYRKHYIEKLITYQDKHVIKILTGVRRCGKSTILQQFKQHLINTKISINQIIFYDFSDQKIAKSLNWESLLDEILKKSLKNKINYLLLDEIQEIGEFERCIITLFENKKIKFDIYLTGSNSTLFSSKLATYFTGRNIEIKVFPFSFSEYINFYRNLPKFKEMSNREIFENYLTYGGLPVILEYSLNKQPIKERLLSVISDTINKDIRLRYDIRTFNEFKNFVDYVFQNNGTIFKTRNIVNYLHSNNKSTVSYKTINNYLVWLCESWLIYRIDFYNIKGKRILETSKKYYVVDQGLHNVQNDFNITDRGRLLECIVYLELIRRNYDVSVGKLRGGKEVDFVATKDNQLFYYQVTSTMANKSVQSREYNNLLSIKDSYKKILLTEDTKNIIDGMGIETKNIIDWLLDNK